MATAAVAATARNAGYLARRGRPRADDREGVVPAAASKATVVSRKGSRRRREDGDGLVDGDGLGEGDEAEDGHGLGKGDEVGDVAASSRTEDTTSD